MITLLAFLMAPSAEAAGYYTSDVGVRAFSRGGAYVAGCNDLLALWYNPAALTRLGNGVATVDVAAVSQQVSFDRKDYPGEGPLVDPDTGASAPATSASRAAASASVAKKGLWTPRLPSLLNRL